MVARLSSYLVVGDNLPCIADIGQGTAAVQTWPANDHRERGCGKPYIAYCLCEYSRAGWGCSRTVLGFLGTHEHIFEVPEFTGDTRSKLARETAATSLQFGGSLPHLARFSASFSLRGVHV